MRQTGTTILALFLAFAGSPVSADEFLDVALTSNDVGTLHVAARIGDTLDAQFLLDTGSAYVVLTDRTRRALAAQGALTRVRELRAVMANNATARAQVYRVSRLRFDDGCEVRDFEAVALPGARKDILGLSVLRKVAPFTVNVDPLRLQVTCSSAAPANDVLAWSGAVPSAR